MDKHLFRVSIAVKNHGRCKRVAFTGKLVKSLVIDGNPSLREFFEKTSGSVPKLVHVTPLFVESSKIRCVRSLAEVIDGRYTFYVGFAEAEVPGSPPFDAVYTALVNIGGRHRFKDATLDLELLSVESIDTVKVAEDVVANLVRVGKLKVVFASPTLLRDPLKTTKHKSLTPTPMNIFSTPVYVNLYVSGRLRRSTFLRTLLVLHRLLSEPYSFYKTVSVVKVKYEEGRNPIPALAGYVNLYLNRGYYEKYASRGVDAQGLLKETISTALALGIGTSRATGFGHIIIQTPPGSTTDVMGFPETQEKAL